MPTPHQHSRYQTYEISVHEQAESLIFSPAQKARLQNDLVGCVEQRIGLAPNDMSAASKESYWQQEAYIRGQIDYINYLLAASTEMEQRPTEPQPVSSDPI